MDETQTTSVPTRIVGPPVGRGRGTVIKCDNGKEYRLKELAGIVGISSGAFSARLKNHGWDYAEILSAEIPRGKGFLDPRYMQTRKSKESLLSRMSDRGRIENLHKISGPTEYELNLYKGA